MFGYSFTIITLISTVSGDYQIKLSNDGPVVKGGVINFIATVLDDGSLMENSKFEYYWEDDAIPTNRYVHKDQGPTDIWSVPYSASLYPAGEYIVQVSVKRCVMFEVYCYNIGSARDYFRITESLNGAIHLEQHNRTLEKDLVSSNGTVIHVVDIKRSDMDYVRNATSILTYWFVDCTFNGTTSDFKFPYNYTRPDEDHRIEALVEVDFDPPPPSTTVPPSTTTSPPITTTKPTTTPKTTVTTPKITVTTPKITVTTPAVITTQVPMKLRSPIANSLVKRSVDGMGSGRNKSMIMVNVNGTLVPYNGSFPYVCGGDQIAVRGNKTYGFFQKKFGVRAPVSNINITGNTWLQPSDVLSLKVTCSGSHRITYCVYYEKGFYNVTGNETCSIYLPLDKCEFPIIRYFLKPLLNRTIIVIMRNDVSHVVKSVFVNIYKVNKQTQLSVIVVPVAFSLVAVVLIIFGVAYYIQNRSSFIVEVADFNFRQELSDIEYKTFRERLRDSIANAFTRAPTPSTSEVPVWPPGGQGGQKYGSMT